MGIDKEFYKWGHYLGIFEQENFFFCVCAFATKASTLINNIEK